MIQDTHYLAGLWEGDGHGDRVSQKYIAITFHRKDLPLVHALQAGLGGSIRHKEKENAYVLTLRRAEALQTFFVGIQNKLRTPKHYDLQAYTYSCGMRDSSDLFSNGWLAGFLDADSGFKIRYTHERRNPITNKITTKHRIALSFVLEQRQFHPKTGEPFEHIMAQIADAFGVRLGVSKHSKKEYWCVEVSSFKKLHLIIDYLDKYPLMTSKFLDYQDWKKAYGMLQRKEHLTKKGKVKLLALKRGMNRGRVSFDWSHLRSCFT
jgi:hypothetical protein